MKVWAAGITAGTVALLVGGALAVAATQNATTLAPGLRIAGTDVSGMTREQALAAVGSRAATPPQVTVTAGKNTWTLSAEKLGWHVDAQTSVDAALKITQERGVLQKLQGMIGQAPTQDIPLTAAVDPAKARTTLTTLTAGLNTAPKNAFTVTLGGTARKGGLTALQVADLYWVRDSGIEPDEKTLKAAFGRLTDAIDQPALNARYVLQGGKLVKAKEKAGLVTDRAAAYALFRKAVLDPAVKTVVFPSKADQPTLTIDRLPAADKLQLIAVGKSTYYGSSAARRTNVANAASKINGAVVPSGEVFSFLNTLGGIDASNGFVGGLIISGGRTVDGLGGGVCQVSTTVFRALYQAGLPVVERNQHSYRVGYYEPQVGFEAAVYDPGLDLKLKNDTTAPILIKANNDNARSTLTVEVWGVKPQRTVTVSPAVITARVPHPAPRYVVNTALRPGVVRQVDWAADGYSLYITRTIKDAKGVRTDKVSTVYKAWQAVYETGPRG
ncbi:VanW family protein [Deinococcus daejeonensis]|nr:VanW family protein [Deinococcus daejeonensis]